jgi:recombination protein RecT
MTTRAQSAVSPGPKVTAKIARANRTKTDFNYMTQNSNTAVATRKDILAVLQNDNLKKQVALALPKHMNADRMLRVMLTTVNAAGYVGEKLRQCTPESLIASLMKCSQYGLEPDGRHAHLIPYGKECQLIFDYKGLVALVRRSGEIKTIHADVVYENDEFSYCYGTGAHLRHKPILKGDRGDIIAAYSFVVSSTGEESFEVMSVEDVWDIRDQSQGYQYAKQNKKQTPWDSHFAEMAKKTVFRRHSKWLPLSFELKEAITADDESPEARFEKAKPAKVVEGMFGQIPETTDEPESATEPASAPAEEPPQTTTKPRKPKAEPATQPPETTQPEPGPQSQPANPPARSETTSPLVNDKTRFSQWAEERGFTWSMMKAYLLKEYGNWVSQISDFSDLSLQQAKTLFNARADIENAIVGQPQ